MILIRNERMLLNDVKTLYYISISYCGNEETSKVIDELPNISGYLHELHENDINGYEKILSASLNLLTRNEQTIRR